jgi:hypothetical protein
LFAVGCSSSSSDTPSGGAQVDRAEKMSALTSAQLPALCDAWAAVAGGYGSAPKTKDCGGATATSRPPTSQADCISAFETKKATSACTATVGGYLDCKAALYANPCATVGEAPTCTIFATSTACASP